MTDTNATRLPLARPAGPLVVSYGAGVDSTAMLIEMKRRGIRPDAVLFADTGSERAWTYQALLVVSDWVRATWGIELAVVRTTKGGSATAPYVTLYGNCSANETLPDILFSPGKHGCSVEWKGRPLDAWTLQNFAAEVEAGQKIVRAIGYDASPADTRRSNKACAKAFKRAEAGKSTEADDAFDFWYPLQDWGLTRDRCEEIIREEMGAELLAATGFDTVRKSACIMCPSMTKPELEEMARDAWGECLQALALELRAIEGKHGLDKFAGLGRSYRWSDHLDAAGLLPADWRAQAVAAGYLPADWAAHTASMDAERTAFTAPFLAVEEIAQAELDAAVADLPADVLAELSTASKAGHKRLMGALLSLPYPATTRLRLAVEGLAAAKTATTKTWGAHKFGWKRIARSSDWVAGTAFEPAGLREGGMEQLAAIVERVAG